MSARLLVGVVVVVGVVEVVSPGFTPGALADEPAVAPPSAGRARALVRLLVPTVPEVLELSVLTRAELAAAGFLVEERAIPPGEPVAWIDEARRDRALAIVVLDPEVPRPRARVILLRPDTRDDVRFVRSTDAPAAASPGSPSESALAQARTTLAVRIAEQIREHRDYTSVATGGRAPAAPTPGAGHRLEATALAGPSLHPDSPSVGLALGVARIATSGVSLGLDLVCRTPIRALAAAGGSARAYEAAALLAVGFERPLGGLPVIPFASLGVGAQQTLLVGRGAPGFVGHTDAVAGLTFAARVGLALPLTPRWQAVLVARVSEITPRPLVLIDEATANRAAPGYDLGLGLRVGL